MEEENQEWREVGTLSQDRADLHRGVILNTIGSVIKLGHPSMGIAIWLYGGDLGNLRHSPGSSPPLW